MKLSELEPYFLEQETGESWRRIDNIREADGILFLCPVCFVANKGPVGTHSIICWIPKVPLSVSPGPGRWNLVGTGLEDLSLVGGGSSVFLTTSPCKAHFFVTKGEIRMCG